MGQSESLADPKSSPVPVPEGPTFSRIGDADYWHSQFAYAMSGLSWAVGFLEMVDGCQKDNYAARVLERLNQPQMLISHARDDSQGGSNPSSSTPLDKDV